MSDKVGTVAGLDAHPLAEIFPLKDHESITALADDIKQYGLNQQILILV